MTKPTVLLIGGPETGKSNFLFKLWSHIFAGRGCLEKDGLPTDLEYLREGAACQMRGEYAGHTSHAGQIISRIPVRLKEDPQKRATLIVPDIDGEHINKVYRDRKWSPDWDELITAESSFLLFVRVNSTLTISPLDWVACHELYGFSMTNETRPGTDTELVPNPPPDAQRIDNDTTLEAVQRIAPPTQIVLVDWLQFILSAITAKHPNPRRLKLGIVVTAWDSVPSDFVGGPAEWICENMPFLHQFCESNKDAIEVSYFGSSIFSGDPQNNPEYSEQIQNADTRTLGYIQMSLNDQEPQDFTIPIAWALGWESGS